MKDDIKKAKKVIKDCLDVLGDFFDEKLNKTITKEYKKEKMEIALADFDKKTFGKTNFIAFRILIGQSKKFGDTIYEAHWEGKKKKPIFYIFKIKEEKAQKHAMKKFQDVDWKGYDKVKKIKDMEKFLEYVYKEGVQYKKKRIKKEEGLDILLKKGLKTTLKTINVSLKNEKGADDEMVKKVAKTVAIAAATTIVSAALTPVAGMIIAEATGGGGVGGAVIEKAGESALQGVKALGSPDKIVKKVITKGLTKGMGKD